MSRRRSFRQALKRAVAERRLLVVPGAYDALSALLIERTGFDTMFVGGFPVAGARYGVPDIGLKGFADIAAAVRDILAACDVPVLVDIDDGYGDVKNAVHTVQSYERMGASAVFLEDQAWPKRCGHMAGKKVVPAEIMEAKIRATMAERLDAETLICVRTDARAVLGFDEALRRAERYINAGAEAIFVEAPESIDELERLARSFDVPQFANPLVGGRTPILSPQGIRAARIQRDLLRPRNHHARCQGDENGARGHARGHLRAARPGHGLRGVQSAGPLRPLGPHRQSLWPS